MKVLVTGANGFIGRNLSIFLSENNRFEVIQSGRSDSIADLGHKVSLADIVIHLAGENRPKNIEDFSQSNINLTHSLCEAIRATERHIPIIFTSSSQVSLDNPYGQSKLSAEGVIESFSKQTGNPAVIYRLPGVFGKWCKPNYNSVVATFCHNIANDLPIQISDSSKLIKLVYIDSLVKEFADIINRIPGGITWGKVEPTYEITLGELAFQIESFKNCRTSLISEKVGAGLTRALYSTYMSYLPPSKFSYEVPKYGDERGIFVEMLKTADSGQFSFFTAHPGITRGGHYHHTKTEKFLVIKGLASFRFRHIVTNQVVELTVSGDRPQIVETIPGWAHEITNCGDHEMIVMLWANEVFDRNIPDTIACKV